MYGELSWNLTNEAIYIFPQLFKHDYLQSFSAIARGMAITQLPSLTEEKARKQDLTAL